MKYALQIVVIEVVCDAVFLTIQFTGQIFTCTNELKLSDGTCPIPNGETVIRNYQFDEVKVRDNFLILIGMPIFYRVLTFVVLYRVTKKASGNV